MKYIAITGGLGNQMFIYAFCMELQKRGKKARLFIPFKNNSKRYGHQGYELKKLFNVLTPNSFWLVLYSKFLRLFPKKYREKLYRLCGVHVVKVPENFIFYPEVFEFRHKQELFRGTWQSELFFENSKDEVRKAFVFNENLLSEESLKIKSDIDSSNSVSIHVRRGDYLSEQYASGFANICTLEYYKKGVDRITQIRKDKALKFFVFTDDPEWVQDNFQIENAVFVTHNYGNDSWQDMYLMSRCKDNIIANSSFSWWGAWLNDNPEKTVIAPSVWWRGFEKDDVVPSDWIRI